MPNSVPVIRPSKAGRDVILAFGQAELPEAGGGNRLESGERPDTAFKEQTLGLVRESALRPPAPPV